MCPPPPFSSHSETLSNRVTHARAHVVWTRPEGAESRWSSNEANAKSKQSSTCRKTDLDDNALQHLITRPREQSGWTTRACARAELTFWGLFFSLSVSLHATSSSVSFKNKEKAWTELLDDLEGAQVVHKRTLALFFPFAVCDEFSVACFIAPTGGIPAPTQPQAEASHLTGHDRTSQGSCPGLGGGVILSWHTAGAPR